MKCRLINALAIAVIAVLFATTNCRADVITIQNTTQVQAFNGTSPYGFFGGASWGASIGVNYVTSELVVDRSATSIDFQFHTEFNGPDTSFTQAYGVTVYDADIFINPGNATAPPGSYGYAIALGDQIPNGGVTAGFYSVESDKTSQQIWGSRTSFVYGGEYAPQNDHNDAQLSPTVLTSGTFLPGWTTTVAPWQNGILDVSLTAPDATQFSAIFDDFDLFWGTGDCSNAPIFAAVGAPVPEPASIAVFGAALAGLGLMRRRNRA